MIDSRGPVKKVTNCHILYRNISKDAPFKVVAMHHDMPNSCRLMWGILERDIQVIYHCAEYDNDFTL